MTRPTLAVAILGAGQGLRVGFAGVRAGGLRGMASGVRAAAGPIGPDVTTATPAQMAELRGQLMPLLANLGARAEMTVVVPTAWCAVRPMPVNLGQWESVKPELERSVEKLFPMASGAALLGMVMPARGSGEEGGGEAGVPAFVLATARARVNAWVEALQKLTGLSVRAVMGMPMVLSALGVQHAERAAVLEDPGAALPLMHRLRYGRIVSLAEPAVGMMGGDEAQVTLVVDPQAGASAVDGPVGARVGPVEVAVAGAIAAAGGAGSAGTFAPFKGATARVAPAWMIPAAAGVIAAGLLLAGPAVRAQRYEKEAARLEARIAELQPRADAVTAARARVSQASALVERGLTPAVRGWGSIMPALRAAQEAVPGDGFLYRVEITPEAVVLQGEAKREVEVLARMQSAAPFASVTRVDPPLAVEDRGLESFHIRALRRGAVGEAGGNGTAGSAGGTAANTTTGGGL